MILKIMKNKESSYQKLKRERDEWKKHCYNLVLRPSEKEAISIAVRIEIENSMNEYYWQDYFSGNLETPKTFSGFAEIISSLNPKNH